MIVVMPDALEYPGFFVEEADEFFRLIRGD